MSDNEIQDIVLSVVRGDTRFGFLNGNSVDVLRNLPDESVNCIITSPPYWAQREYDIDADNKELEIGREQDYNEYVAVLKVVFKEAKRVLRKDGSAMCMSTCFILSKAINIITILIVLGLFPPRSRRRLMERWYLRQELAENVTVV